MVFYIISIIFFIPGVVFFFLRKNLEKKIYQIKSTETKKIKELQDMCKEIADEIGPGGYHEICEIKGNTISENPLISEIGKKPCVYYEMKVTRKWEETYYETDSEGRRRRKTRRGEEVVSSNKRSIEFWVEDDSARIKVAPSQAKIDPVKVVDSFQQGEGQTAGSISFMGITLNIPAVNSGRRTIGYHYVEKIIPINRPVYILGEASDSSGELKIQAPTEKEKMFFISHKSEEEILHNFLKKLHLYKILFVSGISLGIIFAIIGIIK